MLKPLLAKNDKKAHTLIWIFSAIVFIAITVLDRITLSSILPFNPHVFAFLSALVNTGVAILLIVALIAIKKKNFKLHKNLMLLTMTFSILFLVFYIAHHLFTGETKYGDINHDGFLSLEEKNNAGVLRYVYYFIISTHIILAGIIMPFVLYTAYRALIAEYTVHKKLARFTFPVWLYVAITGVLVYILIKPYYLAQ